jgi:hypothetical protein
MTIPGRQLPDALFWTVSGLRILASQPHCQEQKIQAQEEERRVAYKVEIPHLIVSECAVLRVARIIADGKLSAGVAAEATIWNLHLLARRSSEAERSSPVLGSVTFPGNQSMSFDNRRLCQRRSHLRALPQILHLTIIRESAMQSEVQKEDSPRRYQRLREPYLERNTMRRQGLVR